jgi:4,5-DOPA dioxygenase extradiol
VKAPSVFVAHGAPSLALQDDAVTRALRAFGETLDGARAIAVVSAHWQTRGGIRVNAVAKPEVIYDFGGFAPELYTLRYDAPGDPELAREIAGILDSPERRTPSSARAAQPRDEVSLETERGWDHGLWVPLRHIRLRADIPIVEISLPTSSWGADVSSARPRDSAADAAHERTGRPLPSPGDEILRIGAALAPLRDRGIVVMGTGGIVHNLRRINFAGVDAPAEEWARAFDGWVEERIEARDYQALANYESAPFARDAVPTSEHYEPLLIAAGAAGDDAPRVIVEAFHYGTLSMRSVAFGSSFGSE